MESSKVKQELFDVNNENLQKLASLFPSAVKDGQLDIDALKEELGQCEEVGQEKYELTWAGKQNAKKEARRNVLGKTLRYIEGDGVDEDTTQNLYIEGDNLEVLKLLRKNYYGKIKMIYIDPPYNTGNDFVYNDNFSITQEELEKMQGERDEYNERLQKNTKDSARYHTNWLNMMYPRLQLAKDLLTDDGVIFISIDDNEQSNLKRLCDEIFGSDNFINCIAVKMSEASGVKMNHQHRRYPKIKEYILLYKKSNFEKFVCIDKFKQETWDKENNIYLENLNMSDRKLLLNIEEKEEKTQDDVNKVNEILKKVKKVSLSEKLKELNIIGDELQNWCYENSYRIIKTAGSASYAKLVKSFDSIPSQEIACGLSNEGILFYYITDFNRETKQPRLQVIFADSNIYKNPCDFWQDIKTTGAIADEGGVKYKNGKKPLKLLHRIIKMTTSSNDIILDFFSGSSTTAHACMDLNNRNNEKRRFILVQIPENLDVILAKSTTEAKKDIKEQIEFLDSISKPHQITELGKERIRRAGKKIKEDIEAENQQLKLGEEPKKVPDIGFKVFRVGETTLNWEKLNLQGKDIYHDYIAGTSEKDKLDFTPDFKNDLNVVYEIMLRQEGLPLTSKIEKLADIGSRTYLVADSYLISLEEDITPEMVEKLSTLNPLPIKFVFRDSAFDDNIVFKDETFRRLNALIDKNTSDEKKTYTVEFI